jgi:rsbT co-antagonist protein RsbR
MRLRIDEQQAHQMLLIGQAGLCVVFAVAVPLLNFNLMLVGAALVGLVAYSGLYVAYRAGWAWSRPAAVVITTLIVTTSIALDPVSRATFSPVFFVPLVFALIFVGPLGTLMTGAGMLILMALLVPMPNPYLEPLRVLVLLTSTAGLALARAVIDTMRAQAEQALREAEQARAAAEAEAATATAQAAELRARDEEQRHLLAVVADLEVAAITLHEGVLLAPLVGAFDTRRMRRVADRLLASVSGQRIKLLIIDLAGLSLIDTQVIHGLANLRSAIRLLGCDVVVTGISAQTAIEITREGVVLTDMMTARSPQEALALHRSVMV